MDEQTKLIFYPQWYNVIRVQPDSLRLALYDAILQYKYEGVEPTDPMVLMAFGFIKQQIDTDNQKYIEACEAHRIAGCKGGRPRKNQNNQTKPNGFLENQNNQTEPKKANNNSNNNCNCNNKENNNILPSSKEEDMSHEESCNESISYIGIVKFWNGLVKDKALHPISGINEGSTRRTMVQARIKQYGKNLFAEALRKAAASAFLNGNNSKGKVFNFDWIIKPNNFSKVLEGNYDNTEVPTRTSRPAATDWSAPTAGELALKRKREFAEAKKREQES